MKCAILFVVLAACVGDIDVDDAERRKPRPRPSDAPIDAPIDAPAGSTTGTFTCYATTAPAQTCSAPSTCCFDGTAAHSGTCAASACSTYGALACDGPEDCASGQKCCATITSGGVTVGCAAECLPYFQGGDELCHEPSICSGGRWCVTAWGTQPALPRTVSICR